MTLKTRLSLSVTALVTIVLFAVLTLVTWRASHWLILESRAQRRTSVRELVRLCETTLSLGQEKILLNFLGLWTQSNQVVDVGIWDRAGVLQTHSDFLKGDYSGVQHPADPALVKAAMAAGGLHETVGEAGGRETLDLTAPLTQDGKPYGFLRARFDRARLDAERWAILSQTIREVMLLGIAVEALGLLVGLSLAWNLTRPIRALSESAREIGSGRFPETVPVRRSDELGGLALDLERMSGQLRQASEFKDSFLRRISHNMRSPLAAMESALYHARAVQAQVSASVVEDYEILQQGIGELTIFINNLLDLERIRHGKMVYRYEACSLEDLAESVVGLHRRLADDKELRMFARSEGAVPAVRADRGVLAQILSNLVLNAIKFTPADGEVSILTARDGAGGRLTVADTGWGISAASLDKLFKDFVQLEPGKNGAPKGSGIGLAFCKEAAEAMGGRLWVESEPGRGSRFHLWMPEAAG
jgi:signal transduction histidine kinase